MVSYLGTPPVATFEIEGSAVGKYVISGKCRCSPNTEYKICMYLKWKFSLNIRPISMIFCSVRYLHTPWTCCKKPFMKSLSSQGGELILCSVFLLWCWHAFNWFVSHGLRFVWIAKRSMKALQKTVYEMVEFSGRWVYFIQFFYFDAGIPLTGSFSMVPDSFE